MVISVIIPHHYGIPGAEEWLAECIASLEGYDELIVIANDGLGFGAACNLGFQSARGDYLVMSNNDIVLTRGSLRDLAQNDAVTKPYIHGQPDQKPRAFYCMPRWVYERVGGYDERFKIGYFEDDDLIRRWEEAGVSYRTLPEVRVSHRDGGGNTIKHVGQDGNPSPNGEQENFEANERRFNLKWGT